MDSPNDAKDMLDVSTGVKTFPSDPARARAVLAGVQLVDAAGLAIVFAGLEEDGNPLPPIMVAAGAAAAE